MRKGPYYKINRVKLNHDRKIFNLGLRTANLEHKLDPKKVIYNFSSRHLSKDETEALSHGLKFGLPPTKLNYCKYFLPFEKLFGNLKEEPIYCNSGDGRKRVRSTVQHLAFESFFTYSHPENEVYSNIINSLKSLSRDPSIVIIKPDKGNGVVILDKDDYHSKMETILQDPLKFSVVNEDWFKTIIKEEDQVNRFLINLRQNNHIDKITYDELRVSSSKPGILYGLPKVHKPGTPLRPILSSIGTCGYNLSKFLVPHLEHLTVNEFTVKDSFSFADEISKHQNSDNLVMASFDVKSLFTNIPLEETIDIIANSLYSENNSFLSFPINQFKKLLSFAVKNTLFLFNDKMYRQLDGVAMDSPLGPSFANIFLSYHEKQWLQNCPSDFKPTLYRRYIDDTFLLFRDPAHIPKFLVYINSCHASIQFTCGFENNNQLNFLDICISRYNNKFETSVYRKPTFTGLTMNFNSFITKHFKYNLISCLIFRAFKICSSEISFDSELKFLRSLFAKNSFPCNLIDKLFVKTIQNLYICKPHVPSVPKKDVFICLPYLGNQSFIVRKKLMSLVRRFYPHVNLKCIFRNSFTIGSLFCFKDRLPLMLRTSVIYQFSCGQCSSSYIGQTVKQLKVRISQHKGRSFRTNNLLTCPENSIILEHSMNSGHSIHEHNFKILDNPHNFDLRILESLWIHKLKPSLNDRSSSTELSIVW